LLTEQAPTFSKACDISATRFCGSRDLSILTTRPKEPYKINGYGEGHKADRIG